MKEKILNYLLTIPKGKVTTYKNIAKIFGVHPRMVSQTMRYNKNPEIFPCYKVIASNGKISGYNTLGGVEEKIEKLKNDGIVIENGVIDQKFII
ncbi:MAG: MGMT family protein [Candidatus Gracilibacteria bacterium]|nr:MGMT family protein [Candidatus Gracilibacteria bacterium]